MRRLSSRQGCPHGHCCPVPATGLVSFRQSTSCTSCLSNTWCRALDFRMKTLCMKIVEIAVSGRT